MKLSTFVYFLVRGLNIVLFKSKKPLIGTIIITDLCNLKCKHCSVNNKKCINYSYENIISEMHTLYKMGVRILFLYGGEPFLWSDGDKHLKDLVIEAKKAGMKLVNVVTNGTHPIDLMEADLIMVSLDGDKETHNIIRGCTYDLIMKNVEDAKTKNICFYMAINKLNKEKIEDVVKITKETKNVKAVSFNFHTPYPDTTHLSLSQNEKKEALDCISKLIDEKYPIFNLRSVFPYLVNNSFPTPCKECVIMEDGKLSICGRCIDVPNLCGKCGYFFVAEYTLCFKGDLKVIFDMLKTYSKYL